MIEILQIAGSLGVGAFLGTLIFIMYRKDRLFSEAIILGITKNTEDRLTKLLEADVKSREKNTEALTELITVISRMNGRH